MGKKQDIGAPLSGRATAAEPVVSALRDGVPSAGPLYQAILNWREAEAKAGEARGEKMFMSKPDAWFEDVHWFCINGHVSGCILGSERHGDCCLACGEYAVMGPPIGEREFAPILKRLAQAIEARQGGDGTAPSQDESAVRQDAPETHTIQGDSNV